MDTDIRALLDKVPLAEAVWLLWNDALPDEAVNALFHSHRGRCYEREFTFANVVHLVNDALFQHGGHGRQTLIRQSSTEYCPASEQAFYGKLRRMPIALSEAFLADGAHRLRPWLPAGHSGVDAPPSLRDFRILVMDGKTFKRAAKRLKLVRGRAGRGLGGKALVALDLVGGLLVGMAADPDGHANEARLVPRLLAQVRSRLAGPRLWVADRQFGDLAQVRRCTEDGDHCVLRLHPHSRFLADPGQPVRRGADRSGRTWIDERGTLSSTRQGALPMRRITLLRADKPPLEIVTDLVDADLFPADELLELYRRRWGIEQVFQQITEVFHLSHLIGSSPKAIIFQGALCMMVYNLLQLVRAILAEVRDRPASTISTANLFYDLRRALTTLHYLVEPQPLLDALRAKAAAIPDLRAYLCERLQRAWEDRWIKSPPKKRHLPPRKHKRGTGGHFSIHRVLLETQRKKDV
jgi:hypothetical protein